MYFWSLKKKRIRGRNTGENNSQNIPKTDENYTSIDPRTSVNLKYKKHEEIYKKEHHNQITKNQSLREKCKAARDKRYVSSEEQR